MAGTLVLSLAEPAPGLPPRLVVTQGQVLTLGRGAENDLRLEAPFVPRRLARLDFSGSRCTIDQTTWVSPSAPNVYVNDRRVVTHALQDGDRVLIGGRVFTASYRDRG